MPYLTLISMYHVTQKSDPFFAWLVLLNIQLTPLQIKFNSYSKLLKIPFQVFKSFFCQKKLIKKIFQQTKNPFVSNYCILWINLYLSLFAKISIIWWVLMDYTYIHYQIGLFVQIQFILKLNESFRFMPEDTKVKWER